MNDYDPVLYAVAALMCVCVFYLSRLSPIIIILYILSVLCTQDVLIGGQGTASDNHPGNHFYRSLVNNSRPTFRATRVNKEKRAIASNIMTLVKDTGGRFLVEDKSGGCIFPPSNVHEYNRATTNNVSASLLKKVWVQISDEKVMAKLMKRLSEKTYKERQLIPPRKTKGRKHDGKNINKNKETGRRIDGENNITNEETEDVNNTHNMTKTANGKLEPKQIRGDLLKHPTVGKKDERYERQIEEYYRSCSHAKVVPEKVWGDILNPSPQKKEDERHERQIREYNRLHQAHLQKQAYEMEADRHLEQALLQKQAHDMDISPASSPPPHHQPAATAASFFQKQAHDFNTWSAHHPQHPRHEPPTSTPPDAFSEEKAWAVSHNNNKPSYILSRAYEQQILEYERLQICGGGDGMINNHNQLQYDNGRFMPSQSSHAQAVIDAVVKPATDDYKVAATTGGRGFRRDYALGDTARVESHMIIETNPERAIDSMCNHDFAWVKRSDGTYSYSILAYRSSSGGANEADEHDEEGQAEECMTFVLNNLGHTKVISKSQWGKCIRLVAPADAISAPSSQMAQPPENINAELYIQMMQQLNAEASEQCRMISLVDQDSILNTASKDFLCPALAARFRERREKERKATLKSPEEEAVEASASLLLLGLK